MAGDVVDRHRVARSERGLDQADRRVDQVYALADVAQVTERDHYAHQAMAAHAQVADIVEEDHARRAARVRAFAQQRADHVVRATRLAQHHAPQTVVIAAQFLHLLNQSSTQIGATGYHQASRFTAGVRIDDA